MVVGAWPATLRRDKKNSRDENGFRKRKGSTMKTLVSFLKDERGLETIEWTIMAALIVLGIVVAVGTLKDSITDVFGALEGEMVDSLPAE